MCRTRKSGWGRGIGQRLVVVAVVLSVVIGAIVPAPVTQTLSYDPAGRLTSASSPSGTVGYTYNDQNLVVSQSGPGASTYAYDPDGNLTSRTDASGTATFTWTADDQLQSMADPVTNTTSTDTYDGDGERTAQATSSGVAEHLTYDGLGRVTTDQTTAANGSTISSYLYGYDPDSNRTSETASIPNNTASGSQTFAYNQADQLTSWTAPSGTTTYGYDLDGDRTQVNGKTSTYDHRDELLTGPGGATDTWSAEGTLTSATSATGATPTPYTYDGLGEQTGSGSATFGYDALGRLAQVGATPLTYDQTTSQAVTDPSGTYSLDPNGTPVSEQPTGTGTAPQLLGTTADGSIGTETTTTGTPVGSRLYDPFGSTTATSKTGTNPDIGFQSAYTNPTSGAVDQGGTWYQPGQDTTGTATSPAVGDPTAPVAPLIKAPSLQGSLDTDPQSALGSSPGAVIANVLGEIGPSDASDAGAISVNLTALDQSTAAQLSDGVGSFDTASMSNWTDPPPIVVDDVTVVGGNSQGASLADGQEELEAMFGDLQTTRDMLSPELDKAAKTLDAVVNHVINTPFAAADAARQVWDEKTWNLAAAIQQSPLATSFNQGYNPAYGILVHGSSAADDLGQGNFQGALHQATDTGVAVAGTALAVTSVVDPVGDLASGAGNLADAATSDGTDSIGSTIDADQLSDGVIPRDTPEPVDTSPAVDQPAASDATEPATPQPGADPSASAGATEAPPIADEPAGQPGADDPDSSQPDSPNCPALVGSQSFSGSTQVELANGATLPIDQIQPGDQVLATDTTTGVTRAHTVDALWVHHDSDLLDVTVTTDHGFSVIHTTDHHLIFDLRTHRWTEAKDLRRGDHVRTQDGSIATVTATTTVAGSADMWDLTVDSVHDFYVVVTGGTGVLVHNEDEPGCGAAETATAGADAVDPAASRVYLRTSTRQAIQDAAPKTADGDFIDPNTGQVIPQEGPFDYGHQPGYEWWRMQQMARDQGWTRQQVIEYENDPSHYQIEDPSSNRSHQYEMP